MEPKPVILILDVGKTNKKWFLFDERYEVVAEQTVQLPLSCDEDGFSCESIELLTDWVSRSVSVASNMAGVQIKAINFSAYGASLVYVNSQGKPIAPLYSYLKPFPQELQAKLYARYGGKTDFCQQTASPSLGSLNSGLQLLRFKQQRPDLWDKTAYALHLPQYLSLLITGQFHCDITSLGCHSALWDFGLQRYHRWLYDEGVVDRMAPLFPSDQVIEVPAHSTVLAQRASGVGLHDSSAALIPYMDFFTEPFLLLSTGTWSITLNPFNREPLTADELRQDCLCYLQYQGFPVKASRLHAGHMHEVQTKKIAAYFQVADDFYLAVQPDLALAKALQENVDPGSAHRSQVESLGFSQRELADFGNPSTAYHALMAELIGQQVDSTSRVMGKQPVKSLFVDGGFSQNALYMQLLAFAFPQLHVWAASLPQASAIGAAMAIHGAWNATAKTEQKMRLTRFSNI